MSGQYVDEFELNQEAQRAKKKELLTEFWRGHNVGMADAWEGVQTHVRVASHRGWLWGWLAGMATFAGIVVTYAWIGG